MASTKTPIIKATVCKFTIQQNTQFYTISINRPSCGRPVSAVLWHNMQNQCYAVVTATRKQYCKHRTFMTKSLKMITLNFKSCWWKRLCQSWEIKTVARTDFVICQTDYTSMAIPKTWTISFIWIQGKRQRCSDVTS